MSLETIRISKQARDQLVTLKRRTGIPNWNTLCRWAFCLSMAEGTPPRRIKILADSPVEMTWRTFAGHLDEPFLAVLRFEVHSLGLPLTDDMLGEQCRLHIHRGIGYLVGDPRLRDVASLIALALNRLPAQEPSNAGDRQTSDGHRPEGVVTTSATRRRVSAHRAK